MKQYFITILLITCFSLQLSAQDKKRSWDEVNFTVKQKKKRSWGEVNFAVEQNLMLSKWFNDSEINKIIPNMNIQYFMFGVDVRIVDEFGAFYNLGMGIRKHNKGFADNHNIFDQINLEEYYVEDLKNKNSATITGKFSVGFFYRIHKEDWTFIPQIGFGLAESNYSRLSYTLKKIGANEKYIVNYGINRHKDKERDGFDNFVLLKLKAERKLSKRFSLNFTAEYNFHIQKPRYTAEYINFYDDTLVETKSIKSNRMHGLTLGVGIGFR